MKRLRISFGFCALVCFLGWLDQSVCLWFLLGMLLHECGHLAAAALLRVSVKDISLHACGAVIRLDHTGYRQELFAAAAGPAVSIIGWFLFRFSAEEFALVSLLLGTVNLLPVFPMDGGRILWCGLFLFLPPDRGQKLINVITGAVCCLLMIGACSFAVFYRAGLWPIIAALVILWRMGQASVSDRMGTSRLLFHRKTDTI